MKKFFKIGCLGFIAFFALIVIILIIDISNDEEQAIEQAKVEEQQKIEQVKLEEQQKIEEQKEAEETQKIINTFNGIAEQVVSESNGIIKDITIKKESNYFWVHTYVDETTWARSNESEKLSFAATIETVIKNSLSPHSTYVDIMSATNKDVLATQKTFGGWKIKR